MNTFINAVNKTNSEKTTRTENGMKTFVETDSKVLDLFAKIGNARKLDVSSIFHAALAENADLAIRVLLWVRDIREGSGERKTFRALLQELEKFNPALAGKIMHKIPLIGRADDLFCYQEAENRRLAFEMFEDGLYSGNALFAKWAPREKSAKKDLARELMQFMGLTPRAYRKLLSENTKVVETQMCAKQWEDINFSHVPSLAASRYQKAFTRNSKAYAQYVRELQKPESERDPSVKINAGAVYPYDVLKSVMKGNVAVADAQFDALPDYIGDNKILPMVDTSGSMTWFEVAKGIQPWHVAASLGIYCAHKNKSAFKDMVLNFATTAKISTLCGSLSQKYDQLKMMDVGGSTNLHSAFDAVLNVATKNNVRPEDMPTHIVIFSDMQFNSCVRYDDSAIEMIARKYTQHGYKMPAIVFWNLDGRNLGTQSPVKQNENGVALVSGFSPALMTSILSATLEDFTPYRMMLKTIMSERYDF